MTAPDDNFDRAFPRFDAAGFPNGYPSALQFPAGFRDIALRRVYEYRLRQAAADSSSPELLRRLAMEGCLSIQNGSAYDFAIALAGTIFYPTEFPDGVDSAALLQPGNLHFQLSVLLWTAFQRPHPAIWLRDLLHEAIELAESRGDVLDLVLAIVAGFASGCIDREFTLTLAATHEGYARPVADDSVTSEIFDQRFPGFSSKQYAREYPTHDAFPGVFHAAALNRVYANDLYQMARDETMPDEGRLLARRAWRAIEQGESRAFVRQLARQELVDAAIHHGNAQDTLLPVRVSVLLSLMLWTAFSEPRLAEEVRGVLHESIARIDIEADVLTVHQAAYAGFAAGLVYREMFDP
jgi:hypothetical protein